jgi:hypothetical protein
MQKDQTLAFSVRFACAISLLRKDHVHSAHFAREKRVHTNSDLFTSAKRVHSRKKSAVLIKKRAALTKELRACEQQAIHTSLSLSKSIVHLFVGL